MTIQHIEMKFLIMAALASMLAVIGYEVLTAPDKRGVGEKISDAVHELPQGADRAARQLNDRTPADKLSDAAHDAGNDIKKTMNHQD